MPLPTPRDNESRDEFISRCVSTLTEMGEGRDNEQRVAICFSLWRDKEMSSAERKAITLSLKDADQGTVTAVFATFNVVDKDGDITLPSAFEDGARVVISAYGHSSWSGILPVGKGVIRTIGNEAILEGRFFLNTTVGREHFEVVKEMGEDQQWSYGFEVVEAEVPKDGEARRILKRVKVFEVSPVLVGAGVGTRTVAVKAEKDRLQIEQLKELAKFERTRFRWLQLFSR